MLSFWVIICGTVEINTIENEGVTFKIKLPLTTAIINDMLVRVGAYIYIIPLLSIVEAIRPGKKDIKTIESKMEVLHVRGKYISLLRLYNFFGIKADFHNPWESLVIIVESNGTLVVIMVDDLMGQEQIVIKSLAGYMTISRAISGASILGDGRVSLIIDIHGLIGEISS